jgi:hypothetical protein
MKSPLYRAMGWCLMLCPRKALMAQSRQGGFWCGVRSLHKDSDEMVTILW